MEDRRDHARNMLNICSKIIKDLGNHLRFLRKSEHAVQCRARGLRIIPVVIEEFPRRLRGATAKMNCTGADAHTLSKPFEQNYIGETSYICNGCSSEQGTLVVLYLSRSGRYNLIVSAKFSPARSSSSARISPHQARVISIYSFVKDTIPYRTLLYPTRPGVAKFCPLGALSSARDRATDRPRLP